MAHAAWLSTNKNSGSGNDTVSVSALSDNTGRDSRPTTLTFKAANVADVVCTVTQAGKPEFVTIQSAAYVAKAGGSVTITGTTNSSKLTFSLGSSPTLSLTLPNSYTANSVSTNNGASISGDPGKSAEFAFSITFTGIEENTSMSSLTAQLIVTPNSGNAATCTITQAAADASLSVSPSSVTLDWDAYTQSGSASFTVTSNTNWTVE